MGTNFYANIKMHRRDKNMLQKYLNDMKNEVTAGDANKFGELLDDLMYDFGKVKDEYTVHLGKRSYGWAFLWDLNDMKYYEPSLYSIMKFIKESNAVIKDEYGEAFTLEQFINEEIGPSLHPSTKPLTIGELDSMPEIQREYIKDNYINKNIPFYRYCTSATYNEMNASNSNGGFRTDSKFLEKCQPYSMYKLQQTDTDFVSYDNLRFALFTDFS